MIPTIIAVLCFGAGSCFGLMIGSYLAIGKINDLESEIEGMRRNSADLEV